MCREASPSKMQRKSFPTSFISEMKLLNKRAVQNTRAFNLSHLLHNNCKFSLGSWEWASFLCLCLISPLHISQPAQLLSLGCPRPALCKACGSHQLLGPHCSRLGRKLREGIEGKSKGNGIIAASLIGAFQQQTYQSEVFSEAVISNLEPSPLRRCSWDLTSSKREQHSPPFTLRIYCFSFSPSSSHCPDSSSLPDKALLLITLF